jgi:hypothetical protein
VQRFWRLVLASLLALAGGVALAAPASAEVTIAVVADPSPAVVGSTLTVSGTGCPMAAPVTVRAGSTVHGGRITQESGFSDGSGAYSLTFPLVSMNAELPFVPGESIAISVYCTGELPGPAHKTKWLTPALPAPPVISLSMAASQVYGHPPRWR